MALLPPYYPPPAKNPACRCLTQRQAFFCRTGHLSECHYPLDCQEAGCSHLEAYDEPPHRIEQWRRAAAQRPYPPTGGPNNA